MNTDNTPVAPWNSPPTEQGNPTFDQVTPEQQLNNLLGSLQALSARMAQVEMNAQTLNQQNQSLRTQLDQLRAAHRMLTIIVRFRYLACSPDFLFHFPF